jgi:hypothetical protein
MDKSGTWLMNHQASVFSQSGEDGIIEKILQTLPERDKWCVEFGALDGKSLSNTRNLIDNSDYSAVLIEGSKSRFRELKSNYSHVKKVIPLNCFVGFHSNDNLDQILTGTPIPAEFDFLSIDIDGNDYHVWKSSSKFTPKVVCIEFNQTIPNEINFIQPADAKISQGSSLSALIELGKAKNYELVCVAGVNAFFVRSQYFPLFEIDDNSIANLRVDLSAITYLFIGYDGTIFLRGQKTMPWHCKLPLNESSMQRLPKFIRKFPESYDLAELLAFGVFLLVSSPRIFFKEIRKRLHPVGKR